MLWPRRLALAMSLAACGLIVGGALLLTISPTARAVAYFAVLAAIGALSSGLGLVVATRRPTNAVGALLAWLGACTTFVSVREVYLDVWSRRPDALPLVDWVVAAQRGSGVWLVVAAALVLLYFPDGRLVSRRWRWVPLALILAAAAFHLWGALDPSPYPPPLDRLPRPYASGSDVVLVGGIVALAALMVLLVVSAASVGVRFRRSDAVRRAQIKWLALAGCGLPGALIGCWVEYMVLGHAHWFSLAAGIVVLVGLPTSTAIAMLRHDLYDVDRALAAAVTYAMVTAVLVGIYAGASFAAGLVLGRGSTAAAAAAAAVAALVLSPVRARLQRRVDRRLYPLRRAALVALEDLGRRTHAADARPEELERVLRAALRDPGLRVGYLVPGAEGFGDASGAPLEPAGAVPVTLGGTQIGVLLASAGTVSRELLREVAAASAVLVEVVRLRLELARALREAESSRARLVQVGYEERRRLERDLHDGAQQRLVSLGMALRVSQRHLDDGTVDVHGLLDQSVAELGTAIAELRQIAHGLRPSSLDDGLTAALVALTHRVPVVVDLDVAVEDLPDDVATTAYYVASEAVANAVKHADAAHIDLHVARCDGGGLRIRVSDDGRGGAEPSGSGLGGLADRVAALGGSLLVQAAQIAGRCSRRCCRARGDRRGLGAVPRGPGQAPRRRRSRRGRQGRGRPNARGDRARRSPRPGHHRHPHAAGRHR